MEGIITVDASREEVERLKAWRAEQAKKVASKSNTETVIDRVIDITKCVVGFAGAVATVVLAVYCAFFTSLRLDSDINVFFLSSTKLRIFSIKVYINLFSYVS